MAWGQIESELCITQVLQLYIYNIGNVKIDALLWFVIVCAYACSCMCLCLCVCVCVCVCVEQKTGVHSHLENRRLTSSSIPLHII